MAQVTIPRWSLFAGVVALVAALALSLGSIYSARGDNHDQTFYACLYAGSISQVNTAELPTNCGRGTPVQWNAQGVAGESGISGYERVSASGQVLTNSTETLTVDCSPGQEVIAGGVDYTGDSNFIADFKITESYPSTNDELSGWTATVFNDNDNSARTWILWAICAVVSAA